MTEKPKESWVSKKKGKKRAGQGSHGSLSKAGKMRLQQPIIWENFTRKTTHKLPQRHKKKSKIPRVRLRRSYEKRFILMRSSGQNKQALNTSDTT